MSSKESVLRDYHLAACVPYTYGESSSPRARVWNAELVLPDGQAFLVTGADMVGGKVAISKRTTGETILVIAPGDYVYPQDIRFDAPRGRLYVKAHGLVAGIWDRTWVFACDIRRRRCSRYRLKSGDELQDCPNANGHPVDESAEKP